MNPRPSTIPHLLRAIAEKRHLHGQRPVQRLTAPNGRLYISRHASNPAQRPSSPVASISGNHVKGRPKISPIKRSPRPEIVPAQIQRKDAMDSLQDSKRTPGPHDVKRRRRYLMAVAYFAVITGAYIAYAYMSYKQDAKRYAARGQKLDLYEDVSDRWHDASRNFDREVEDSEFFMGLRAKRKRLIRDSYGDVLEVSVGTGRNMDLYDTRPYTASEDASFGRSRRHMITSLTFNDQSPVMVQNAQQKWRKQQTELKETDRFRGVVNWIVGDAGDPAIIKRPPGGYDTIIQSMGMCSMPDPVGFLRRLNALCRQPGESPRNRSTLRMQAEEAGDGKGGRIFLLEHGRSYYGWLNRFLDSGAPMHADRYGCWFNKDIGELIDESGLVVERVRRYHLGTTWEIVLRPNPALLAAAKETPSNAATSKEADTELKSSWLRFMVRGK